TVDGRHRRVVGHVAEQRQTDPLHVPAPHPRVPPRRGEAAVMNHVDRDDLLRYRIDRSLVDAELVDAHVAACEPCARELALLDAEDAALRHGETWALVDASAAPRSARLQQATELRKRIERE